MTSADDIKGLDQSDPEKPEPTPPVRREIGPESEVRGGPEAPDGGLDDAEADERSSDGEAEI